MWNKIQRKHTAEGTIPVYVSACNSSRDKWEMRIYPKGEYIHHADQPETE